MVHTKGENYLRLYCYESALSVNMIKYLKGEDLFKIIILMEKFITESFASQCVIPRIVLIFKSYFHDK